MKNIILCSLMLNIGCSEVEKETEAAQNDNKSYFEGDSTGDCTDGEDNDEDGLIDCDDPGCDDREACAEETDTADTAEPADAVDLANGQAIHDGLCMACHTSNPNMANQVPNMTDQEIESVIANGSGAMPAQNVQGQDLIDLIAFLRQEYP